MNAAVTPSPHPSCPTAPLPVPRRLDDLMAQFPSQRVLLAIAVTLALVPCVLFAALIIAKETTP